jgi:transcription factor STE12
MQRHSYPAPSPMSMCLSAPFSTQSFEEAQAQQDQQMYAADPLVVAGGGEFNNASGSNPMQGKAFACPLFSCGRLFKRMEHLKRHLRTHTMERPYECPTCYKKFSRSDNLNQHVRTHGRAGSAGSGSNLSFLGSSGTDTGMGSGDGYGQTGEWEWDGGEGSGEGNGSVGTMETESDESFLSGGANTAAAAAAANGTDDSLHFSSSFAGMEGMADAGLCEVDLHGQVLQDGGDEEGLLVLSPDHLLHHQQQQPVFATLQDHQLYGPPPPTTTNSEQQLPVQAPQPYVAADGQWVTARAHASPAFSAMSVPGSPHVGHITSIRSGHSSITSSPGSYLRHCSPAATTTGLYPGDASGNDYATSISAPSHKLAFDHTAMYAPHAHNNMLGLALGVDAPASSSSPSAGGGGSGGPIRRHRSMTPSLMRGGPESVRRPAVVVSTGTGDGNDSGSGGSTSGGGGGSGDFSAGGRGYHPYANAMAAAYGHAQSRTASAQSSPSTSSYPLQLDYVPLQQQQPQQSTGTGAGAATAAAAAAAANPRMFGDMFRTESPVSFGSPVAHHWEQQQQQHHQQQQHQQQQHQQPHQSSTTSSSSSMSVSPFDVSSTGLFGLDAQPFVGSGHGGMEEYYATVHPQHVTM